MNALDTVSRYVLITFLLILVVSTLPVLVLIVAYVLCMAYLAKIWNVIRGKYVIYK